MLVEAAAAFQVRVDADVLRRPGQTLPALDRARLYITRREPLRLAHPPSLAFFGRSEQFVQSGEPEQFGNTIICVDDLQVGGGIRGA